ncbi:MAG: GAF domain-containing protein [Timaviella obliquedivisa GSE-PSE-MK23-08B]|jgi:twitching motility protein PilJ|nr:GAF domain-containing protein [Timaviella obliquedivisa GSE-PSE-MK23-08B]
MTIQPRQAKKYERNSEESLAISADDTVQSNGKNPPNLQYQEGSDSSKTQSSGLKWFYQLPIRRKQLLALLTSEALSVLGLVGVGSWLIIVGGRTQLANQAKAEVNVSRITYNTRIDQMGFGFRGQAENPIILNAAKEAAAGRGVSPESRQQVRSTLANEVTARNIEYATLVGTDLKIIANANADRTGERFDPNGLVSAVLTNSNPIKVSTIVSLAELQKESPPSAAGLANQDALIRYVITPVRNPETQTVVGVLVAGDVVKQPVVKDTLEALRDGYSAVYQRTPSGDFALATSLDLGSLSNIEQARTNVKLSDNRILQQAAAALKPQQEVGDSVVQRVDINGQTYTVAAEAIADAKGQPIAILVRGTPEVALNNMLQNSLALQFGIASLALLGDILLAGLLGRSIANPIENLRRVTQRFSGGDRHARAEVFAHDEVGELAVSFNNLAENVSISEKRLQNQASDQQQEAERATLLADLTGRMRQHSDRDEIFAVVAPEVRQTLAADRVIVYLLDANGSGTVVAESVEPGYPIALNAKITDPCFLESYLDKYRKGRVKATEDISNAGLTECHLRQLEPFLVKANLVVPILMREELVGLLVTHQCSAPRVWEESDINFCRQVSVQLGFALEQADLFNQRETARRETELLSEDRRSQKEELQLQLIDLLSEVEGASHGDLTVRAEVTAGEIGTVADFFNSIIESLRQIVTQVKQSAVQVSASLGENEDAVRRLSEDALQQAEETTRTLDTVEQMTQSIQRVADSAQQAAKVARTASETAELGGDAMDLTVQNILGLRETVGETAKKVKRLGESSQQISKVVSLINQIAMQTNLLAINAGIEAARAGEEGQGFAVVAEEVGELAARSAAATQEIEKIVDIIQRETNQVVEAMEQSTAQVVEGTHRVEDAKKSLTQIVEVSRQIDVLVQSISEATVSQVQTSASVSKLMKEVAQVSERTSDSSRQVSAALRQTVKIAQGLQDSVGTFEVGEER